MENKHLKILRFLSQQTTPIKYSNFPNSIKSDFYNGINDGSLLHELEIVLLNHKEWIDSGEQTHSYNINENGLNALEEHLGLLKDDNQNEELQKEIQRLTFEMLQNQAKNSELQTKLTESQLKVNELSLIKKPAWRERNWLLIAVAAFVFGFAADIVKELVKRKLTTEQKETIPQTREKLDTSILHK